jgi:AcrR family transcriptional regulator
MKSKDLDVRRRIFDAVRALLAESSGLHFSLDQVAAKAGLSKGGLLYHFANKDALLSALVVDYVEQFERLTESAMLGKKLTYHSAYVDVCLSTEAIQATRVLNSVSAIDDTLLEPLDVANRRWRKKLSASLNDESKGLAFSLLMDGFLISAVSPHSAVSKKDLLAALSTISKHD